MFLSKKLRIDSFLIFILHQIDYQMLFHQLSLHAEELRINYWRFN